MGLSLKRKIVNRLTKWLMAETISPRHIPLCDYDKLRHEIRPCDVLLIEGRSRVSDVIKLVTQSPWSHIALYIGRLHDIEDVSLREKVAKHFKGPPDTQLIIESQLDTGTIISPLSDYKKYHIRICRPNTISAKDSNDVIAFCLSKLGEEYDVRHILDLMRFLLPWSILPRRWRSSLFRKRPGQVTRRICSSLIAEAFRSVHFPILPLVKRDAHNQLKFIPRNPRLFTPNDFDYSPYFDIIKYPFLGPAEYAVYRNLPWDKNGFHSDELGEELLQKLKVKKHELENNKKKVN